jgi:hypothetical protein
VTQPNRRSALAAAVALSSLPAAGQASAAAQDAVRAGTPTGPAGAALSGIYLLDFMSPAQIRSARDGTETPDVAAALSDALAAAAVHPWARTVYVPKGTYRLAEPIRSVAGVCLLGAGSSQTIFNFYGKGLAMEVANAKECGGFSIVSKAPGQSGFQLTGGVGVKVNDIVIRDFDGTGFQVGKAGVAGVYFADINYIECTNLSRAGSAGFLIDGLSRVNSNANICSNVFVKGRWRALYHLKGNANVLLGGDAEPHVATPKDSECYVFAGTGNRVINPYVEPVGGVIPAVFFRFAPEAHSNRVTSVYWSASDYSSYSKIADEGTNNEVEVNQTNFNFPSSPGKNVNHQNLLPNSGFFNARPDGLPVGWTRSGTGLISRESGRVRGTPYSMKLDVHGSAVALQCAVASASASAAASLQLQAVQKFAGRTISVGVWCWSSDPGLGAIKVSAGGAAVGQSPHSGSSSWEFLTASTRVDPSVGEVTIQLRTDKDNRPRTGACYFSEPVIVIGNELPQQPEARALGDGDAAMAGRFTWSPPQTLLVNSATPSVADGNVFTEANTNPITITNFVGARSGQEIKILTTSANTTVKHGATIATTTGEDTRLRADAVYKFLYNGAKWYEF